jgi:putative phosphotransacetylase
MLKIPVEVSARHCHLSPKDLKVLFGKGYKLRMLKRVSQPGQFATKEEITVKGPKGQLQVRIVAPTRAKSQVELAITDCFRLGYWSSGTG